MKVYILTVTLLLLVAQSCNKTTDTENKAKWINEIMSVEKAFNDMALEVGLVKAFEFYAAEDGVIRRKNKVIKGKSAIAEWYEKDVKPDETLTWKPNFVDVSNSGDLAYTYGDYAFSYPDSLGNTKSNTGTFHTVWKRQKDGKWRFVWD